MSRRRKWLLIGLAGMGDVVLFNLGIILAFYLRFLGHLPADNFNAFERLAPWGSIVFLLLFYVYNLYASDPRLWDDVFPAVLVAVGLSFFALMALSFLVRSFAFPRSVFFLAAVLQGLLLLGWRYLIWLWETRVGGRRRVAVVGGNEEAAALAVKLESYPPWFHQVVGFYADFPVAEAGDNLITMEAKWERWLLEHPAETYVICPGIPPEIKMRIAVSAIARGTAVYLVPELYEIFLLGAKIAHVDDVPVLELPELGFSPAATAWKRITDVIFAGIGLVVAAPCMAIIALLVWMTSPGPVLFRQERVGMNGRPFVLYKFRTMRDGAETVSGPVLAKRADPRVTPLGRWLRCSHLDELPQLYNVLHGDMSLVGPRPERPHFFREFAVQVPGYVQRLIVKGGITGLAQVEGKYETSPVDKVRYDLLYAKSFSVFMEVRIMLRTLSALFRKGRAL